MCRNIKQLYNFEPPATEQEIHAAALQFIRKISGTTKPSKTNEPVIDKAVNGVANVVKDLLNSMETTATPKNREIEAQKRREKNTRRFSSVPGR